MKKIMVSHGMRGKDNPKEYVLQCRKVVHEYYNKHGYYKNAAPKEGEYVLILETFFEDFNGNRLQFLGKSISEGLALADEIVFMDDWEKYDGCRSEHFIAAQYGVKCVYLESGYMQ